MLGLVLEGGGARGAYQVGVIRELLTHGYEFGGVAGTSIGALNGVMLAQGTFDTSVELWETMEVNKIFDIDNKYAENLATNKFDFDTIKYFLVKLGEAVSNKGLSTTKIRQLINNYIDEDKLRASKMDFGIMTISLSELKPYEIFLEDIPRGMVADYVMASANFPGFSKLQIGDKIFVDGGLYDNMPINMMINRGYTDILAIGTMSSLPKRKVKIKNQAQVYIINPSEKPGRMLDFTTEPMARAIKMGTYDALRYLKGYVGELYYLTTSHVSPFGYGFFELDFGAMRKIAIAYGYRERVSQNSDVSMRELREHIIAAVNRRDKKKYTDIASCLLHICERVAYTLGVERLEVYAFETFMDKIAVAIKNVDTDNKKDSLDFKTFNIINNNYLGGTNHGQEEV